MEELTIQQKAKAYDEALERVKELLSRCTDDRERRTKVYRVEDIESIFPELKESKEERIKEALINMFKGYNIQKVGDFTDKEIIVWLEKQGEANPYSGVSFKYNGHTFGMCARDGGAEILMDGNLKAFISLDKSFVYPVTPTPLLKTENFYVSKDDGLLHDMTTDKTESKFKVGDWIVENGVNGNPVQITSFEEDKSVGIKVWFSNGTGTYVDFLKGYHKWTINDAQDGDVLTLSYASQNYILIYKGLYEKSFQTMMSVFCSYYVEEDAYEDETDSFHQMNTGEIITPATKEQRDTLFAKMKEAGYEWDAEKKELKLLITNGGDFISENCEQNSAWIGEDELKIPTPPPPFELQRDPFPLFLPSDFFPILRHQPKQEWKPSNEQINTLSKYAEQNNKDGSILTSLYQDLKKLRDE